MLARNNRKGAKDFINNFPCRGEFFFKDRIIFGKPNILAKYGS